MMSLALQSGFSPESPIQRPRSIGQLRQVHLQVNVQDSSFISSAKQEA